MSINKFYKKGYDIGKSYKYFLKNKCKIWEGVK